MTRVAVISVDGHMKPSWSEYRTYLDPAWREPYDEWARQAAAGADFCHPELGVAAQWTPKDRVADLEAQGVVAEVVFPNGMTPFTGRDGGGADPEAVRAGYRAHNRWLIDACAEVPGRIFPQALVDFGDVKTAIEEIHAAKRQGFVGVVMPPLLPGSGSRYFFDPELDPIWAACVETGLPLSQHGGSGAPIYRPEGLAAFLVLATEHSFFSGRSLWQLILGGVFDRFPDLKVAYVETETWWLRPVFDLLDQRDRRGDDWAEAASQIGARPYRRLPSDYLASNIYMGLSPFVQGAAEHLQGDQDRLITCANAMIGVDYPHPETALPWLREVVQRFAGSPTPGGEAARRVICDNAARLYGIDLSALTPLVERFGFELEESPV